jgi:meso-butanediol dehydrogenase/(S,S)-butanediol dehydrogenase/diacetyl reductase
MRRFKDRVVIVTGAGSGIGEATARRFSQEGASVVLAGNTLAKLERVARELPQERTLVKVADVSSFSQVQALVDATIEHFAALHVLFNNAGIAVEGTVTQPPLEDWGRIMAVNVGGVFPHAPMGCAPHLRLSGRWHQRHRGRT